MKRQKFDSWLLKLINILTESGLQETDRTKLTELLQHCKKSPSNIDESCRILFLQLGKPHSEIRWSSLLVISELFQEFDQFKTCLVDRIKDFVRLAVEHDPDHPLPPPRPVAIRVSREACRLIAEWNKRHGQKYIQLELMHKYMKNVYKINFDSTASAPRPQPLSSRQTKLKELQLKKAIEELDGNKAEMNRNLEEFWSCMELLMPTPDNFDVPLGQGVVATSTSEMPVETSFATAQPSDSTLREEGYLPGASVSVVLPQARPLEISENDDNSAVLENLRSCYTLCNKHHFPVIASLLEKLSKLGANQTLLKSAIDLKSKVSKAKLAFENTKITWKQSAAAVDDDDWIDVPQVSSDDSLSAEKQLQKMVSQVPETTDDSSNSQTVTEKLPEQKPPVKPIPKLLSAEIPVEDYTCDPSFTKLQSKEDNIWCNSASFDPDAPAASSSMLAEALSTRSYYFVSKEADNQSKARICGAPIGNGKICPRRDKVKCPFHGPIGKRVATTESKPESSVKIEDIASSSTSTWADPSLQRDISAALGIKLTAPPQGRRKKKSGGLTQLKNNTPKSRIAKKMFTAAKAERIANDMNRRDAKRHNDRFAHSFSYSLSRTL